MGSRRAVRRDESGRAVLVARPQRRREVEFTRLDDGTYHFVVRSPSLDRCVEILTRLLSVGVGISIGPEVVSEVIGEPIPTRRLPPLRSSTWNPRPTRVPDAEEGSE